MFQSRYRESSSGRGIYWLEFSPETDGRAQGLKLKGQWVGAQARSGIKERV